MIRPLPGRFESGREDEGIENYFRKEYYFDGWKQLPDKLKTDPLSLLKGQPEEINLKRKDHGLIFAVAAEYGPVHRKTMIAFDDSVANTLSFSFE